ncbi:putative quinol monooxygenase [Streptomyces sp. HPF1205]|uniref:putative quinol monooxygenase n=1 Tax=Streptomyces sp. HPF1205 TaxID=2873262 RepID=UPI001CED8530|nr:antibiotic biosynthesis monooxygenase [Streptomyces sp. HPF1205]
MVTVGLHIRIEAKPDRAADVEAVLRSALDQVREEEATAVWVAARLGPTTFAVFDAFADEAGRRAHLDAYGGALREAAGELFARPPAVEFADILCAKLPGS